MKKTLLFLLLFLPFISVAQIIPYDLSFNNSGYFIQDIQADDYASSCVVQNDGKTIVVGTSIDYQTVTQSCFFSKVFLIRHNIDGTLDQSFGNSGKIVLDYIYNCATHALVKLQEDNKIVITFNTGIDLICMRFLPDGTLDNSFATNGTFIFPKTPPYNNYYLYARDLDIFNEKIIITSEDFNKSQFISVFRLDKNGVLDMSFGDSTTGITSSEGVLVPSQKSMILNNGEFITVCAGTAQKFSADGIVDNTFGQNGTIHFATIPFPSMIHDVLITDTYFLIAYKSDYTIPSTIKAYTLAGEPINTFGQNNTLIYPYGVIAKMKLDVNNKIVITAYDEVSGKVNFSRHHTNGSLDSTFAQNGVFRNLTPQNSSAVLGDFDFDNNGAIISCGWIEELSGANKDYFVVKYFPNLTVKDIQPSSFKVFPNPTANYLILSYELPETTNLLVELYDASGRLVKVLYNNTEIAGTHEKDFDLSNFNSGIYFLHLKSKDSTANFEIIKL